MKSGEQYSTTLSEREDFYPFGVYRWPFAYLHPRHVLQAAQRPVPLDEKQVNAVKARIELDLRLGVIFTRFQTLTLQGLGGELANDRVISYGTHVKSLSCSPFS